MAIVRVEVQFLILMADCKNLEHLLRPYRCAIGDIDGPGESLSEIYNAVRRVSQENNKTVVASMGNGCGFRGYYILPSPLIAFWPIQAL